jgi:hypothetical protein
MVWEHNAMSAAVRRPRTTGAVRNLA